MFILCSVFERTSGTVIFERGLDVLHCDLAIDTEPFFEFIVGTMAIDFANNIGKHWFKFANVESHFCWKSIGRLIRLLDYTSVWIEILFSVTHSNARRVATCDCANSC